MTTPDHLEFDLRDRRPSLDKLLLAAPLAVILSAGFAFASPAAPKRLVGEKTVMFLPRATRSASPAVAQPVVAPPAVAAEPVVFGTPALISKRAEFGTAKLIFDVPDGAGVWFGKRRLGTAPIAPHKTVEGRHRVKVRLDDATFTEWIDVPAGTTITYRFALSTAD